MTRLVTANRRSKTNGEPRNRQVDTGNLERPAPELTDAYNAANEAISVTYGTREPRRLVEQARIRCPRLCFVGAAAVHVLPILRPCLIDSLGTGR
jgi:hypothetical protein